MLAQGKVLVHSTRSSTKMWTHTQFFLGMESTDATIIDESPQAQTKSSFQEMRGCLRC